MDESERIASHGFAAGLTTEDEHEGIRVASSDDHIDAEIALIRSRLATRCSDSTYPAREIASLMSVLLRLMEYRRKSQQAPGDGELLAAADEARATLEAGYE